MKKVIILIAVVLAFSSCEEKSGGTKPLKTAYVDTIKLMDDYTEAQDLDAKYKAKSKEMGKGLEEEIAKFKADASAFNTNAQLKGMAWAQQERTRLARKEQELSYAQNALLQQLQQEHGTEMDSVVKKVKKIIKDYGKEKGYDYIYSTGEAVTILYAKDQFDITKEMIKLLNDKYKSEGKKDEVSTAKTEEKK